MVTERLLAIPAIQLKSTWAQLMTLDWHLDMTRANLYFTQTLFFAKLSIMVSMEDGIIGLLMTTHFVARHRIVNSS